MKNCGQAGKSSMISAVSMGVNILLNGIFIYVLGFGVIGAAAATVISKLLGTCMVST